MRKILPLFLCLFCIILLFAKAEASDLPPCPQDMKQRHHCFGTQTYDVGTYVGEWKDDIRHGQGTFTFSNGPTYVGEWKDNIRHGQGTFTTPDGNRYVGEFKDDKMHGQGTFTTPDGDRYVGEWKDDKKHGQGTYISPSGDRYVGEWKDDKRHGQRTPYVQNQVFGKQNKNYRILITSKSENLLRIKGPEDEPLFLKILLGGDAYQVPDRKGLTMDTSDAGLLEIFVDGVVLDPIGLIGEIKTNFVLDPESLLETQMIIEKRKQEAEQKRIDAELKKYHAELSDAIDRCLYEDLDKIVSKTAEKIVRRKCKQELGKLPIDELQEAYD